MAQTHKVALLEQVGPNVVLHCSCGWRSHIERDEIQARLSHPPLVRKQDTDHAARLKKLAETQPRIQKGGKDHPLQHEAFIELRKRGLIE